MIPLARVTSQEMVSRPHLRDWCDDHLWAPSCFHGSVGNGWEVVEKYISTQNCADDEKTL